MSQVETVDIETTATTGWEGPLGLEGFATSDRRYLISGEIDQRSLPLPLNVQLMTAEGHDNSVNVGRIDTVSHIPVGEFDRRDEFGLNDVPDTATVIWGAGVFDDSPEAERAQQMMANGAGVSLDLPPDRHALIDPETFEEIANEDADMEDVLAGKFLMGMAGKIAGATIVTVPAFEHAAIRMQDGTALVASAFTLKVVRAPAESAREAAEALTLLAKGGLIASNQPDYVPLTTLLAAAAKLPPREWLNDPNLPAPTPLTYDDGRIYGHLALWDSCHTGYQGICVAPPPSPSNYAYFNTGLVETNDGATIPCGKLMFSRNGVKHASLDLAAAEAARHYDDATKVAGYVRAGADVFGIWLNGFVNPELSELDLQHLKSHPPSGDWRSINGSRELVAAFSVPIPGFPVPHAEARLVASAEGDEIAALILSPLEMPEPNTARETRRKLKALSIRRRP